MRKKSRFCVSFFGFDGDFIGLDHVGHGANCVENQIISYLENEIEEYVCCRLDWTAQRSHQV